MTNSSRLLFSACFLSTLGISASAQAQLPPPAPARQEEKAAPALPAPALPAPAVAPAVAPATPAEEDSVVIVPPDASEFPLRPAKKAPPKTPTRPSARVGGVDVSSGTEAVALLRLRTAHAARLRQPVVLRLGARQWWTTRGELGASLPLVDLMRAARERARPGKPSDVALRFEVDEAAASKYLLALAPGVRREPEAIGDGRTGRDGEELSVSGSLARVKALVESGETSVELLSRTIAFVPKPQPKVEPKPEPKVEPKADPKTDDKTVASGSERFPVLLAAYSTKFKMSQRDRTENLRVAGREMDNTILQPGEVFSANAAIGPRSTRRGFRAAHIFMGRRVVDGVGGGICQTATTLYNAAREARLSIVERHSHSLPVPYATPRNDATIYWGQKDMKFRNNTGAPILVRTFIKGSRFHAQIFGAKAR